MDRAILLLSALLLNALLAGPRRWYEMLRLARLSQYPAEGARIIARRLNRERRSPKELEMRGTLLVILTVMTTIIAGWFCGWLLKHNLRFIELILLALCLPVRPVWDNASYIRNCLKSGNPASAWQALASTPWLRKAPLDEYGLARAAIETLAVDFTEKILAPALFYLAFGLPGLFVSKSVGLLEETLVTPEGGQEFTRPIQKAHFLLHYLPSRLAAALWLAAALFLPSASPRSAARRIAAAIAVSSPQALSLVSVSSLLNLSLGGPTSIYVHDNAWIGDGTAKVLPADIGRALYLLAFLYLLLFILCGLLL